MNGSPGTDFTRRNVAIDLMRALVMFVMIFVNDFWKIHDVPHWMEHAARSEDFMGLADVVFPCFLFVVGMSIPFAIERRYAKGLSVESTVGHILSRTFALIITGAFISNSEARLSPDAPYTIGVYWILMVAAFFCIWNQYPRTDDRIKKRLFISLRIIGVLILGYLAVTFRDPDGGVFAARWGILGLIGWTYLVCAVIYLFTRDRLGRLIPVWVAFVVICILSSRMNEAWGGTAILNFPRGNFYNDFLNNVLHIGNGALPAFTMGGIVFSLLWAKYLRPDSRKKALWVAAAVLGLCAAGFVARRFWIISKIGATPPWIFFVTAIAIGTYACLSFLADKGRAGWLGVIKPAGTATLTCYMMPYLAYAMSSLTGITLPDRLTHGFAGIVNCLLFSLVIIAATGLLERLHVKLKI